MLKIFKIPVVLDIFSKSKSGLYLDIKDGTFPPAISTGKKSKGWPSHEVEAILRARIAGKSETEIRELVADLIADRQRAVV